MRYLVTGGTGFIGQALCAELLVRGHQVTVLSRDAARARKILAPGVAAIEDLAQAGAADAIVNLAGENLAAGRWTAARKQRLVDSRVQATRALVDLIERSAARPAVLISGSAVGWYGARGDETLSENSTSGKASEFQAQLCRAWEAEAQRAEKLGVRVCRLRTGIVLERDGGPLARMLPPFRLGLGGPLGSGEQWLSWIHRADLVAMILWLVESPAVSGPVNGTAPAPVSNRQFARALGAALHRPAALRLPAPVLRLLLGEMADLLLTGQKVLPARALDGGFAFQHADLTSALSAIFG